MRRTEDIAQCLWALELRIFTDPKAFTKAVEKFKLIKLVVVMSAVDWWKSSRTPEQACDFADECRVDIRAKLREKDVAAQDGAIHSTFAHRRSESFPRDVHNMHTRDRSDVFLVTVSA
jgi:hypothetical protein